MKRILLVVTVLFISIINYCPAFGQDIFENDSINSKDGETGTYYCNANLVNVRKLLGTEGEVSGQLLYNTSVEVKFIDEKWTCIGTEDGIAFVCSDYLSNTEMPKKSTLMKNFIFWHIF